MQPADLLLPLTRLLVGLVMLLGYVMLAAFLMINGVRVLRREGRTPANTLAL